MCFDWAISNQVYQDPNYFLENEIRTKNSISNEDELKINADGIERNNLFKPSNYMYSLVEI